MRDGFKVIDADAHMQEPPDLWDKYVEPEFYDRRPIVKEVRHRILFQYETSELFPEDSEGLPSSVWKRRPQNLYDRLGEKYGHAYDDWWSAESRLVDMDRYGWDKMVCIPGHGSAPLRQMGKDPDLMWALTRAYHNWAHDFCSVDPSRLKMVVDLPPYDLKRAVAETRRAVTELGAITVMMPRPLEGMFWHDPEYDPFWSLVSELDVPVVFHGVGSGSPHASSRYQGTPGPLFALQHAIGFPIENMISMGHLIYTGILEKYPGVRASFLEGNAGWLPFWLGRLDDHAVGRQSVFFENNTLSLTPSEYFQRQIFVACDGDEEALPETLGILGDNNLIWNTDYPHTDAPAPERALPELLEQDIPDESKRRILWDNPSRLFGERVLG